MAISKQAFFDTIGYHPHSQGQMNYHQSNARFKVPVCGRRFGKSTMAGKDLEPTLFKPERAYYWIVGPTYDLGEKEFRVVWDDLIIGQKFGQDKRVKKAYNKRSGDMYIELPWGARIEVRSATHPDSLVGEGLSGAIMSEAAKHSKETWERFIRPALSDKRGWATFPTTPEGHNWLHQLWMFGQDPRYPDYASWSFPSWENKIVYPGGREDPEIKLIELTTTPEWFMQEIGADFSSFVGRIYSEFDVQTHCKELHYNPAWPNYIAFDWGFVNPLAAIEFQIDPFDNIYIWREHYKPYLTLQDHIRELKARPQPPGYAITCGYGDAADPEATLEVSRIFCPVLSMPEAKTNWRQGIDTVKMFLKEYQIGEIDEYGTPKTSPKMFVDYSCSNLIREFQNYKAKEGTTAQSPREIAQGIDDHALDALRYGLVHLFILGARSHLADVYSSHDLVSSAPESGYTTMNMEW